MNQDVEAEESPQYFETKKRRPRKYKEATEAEAQDDPSAFHKKKTDKGKIYEDLLSTFFSFKLANDDEVEDFEMASNDKDFLSFDDAVLGIKRKNGPEKKYAVQMKHADDDKNIPVASFLSDSGDFSLKKYFEDFRQIKKRGSDFKDYIYILYTNKGFEKEETKKKGGGKGLKKKPPGEQPKESLSIKVTYKGLSNFRFRIFRSDFCPEIDLLNTAQQQVKNDCIFKLEVIGNEEEEKALTNEQLLEIQDFADFCDWFYLFTQQSRIDRIEQEITQQFKNKYNCDTDAYKVYYDFISIWSQSEGTKPNTDEQEFEQQEQAKKGVESKSDHTASTVSPRNNIQSLSSENESRDEKETEEKEDDLIKLKLTKPVVRAKIAEALLTPHIKILPMPEPNKKSKILEKAILKFDLTLVDSSAGDTNKKIWGITYDKPQDLSEVNEVAFKYELIQKPITDVQELKPEELIKISWYMGKVPLVVEVTDTSKSSIYEALKLCKESDTKKTFVLVGPNISKEDFPKSTVFQGLKDLEPDDEVYLDIIEEFTLSLQGREAVPLRKVFLDNHDLRGIVMTSQLVQMVASPVCVGEKTEFVPKNFVNTSFSKILIDHQYFDGLTDCISLITESTIEKASSCVKSSNLVLYEDYLKPEFHYPSSKFVLVKPGECSVTEFKTIISKDPNKPWHLLRLTEHGNLEWIATRNGTVSALRQYRIDGEKSHIFDYSNKKLNMISGDTGMGKTIMLSYLKSNYDSDYWMLRINLREHFQKFQNQTPSIDDLLKSEPFNNTYTDFEKSIRDIFIQRDRIVVLWDGVDEMPPDCIDTVAKTILTITERDLCQWVTVRSNLRQILEDRLNIFALLINPLNKEQQKDFIKTRLETKCGEQEAEAVVAGIFEALSAVDGDEFLNVLHNIALLTELFYVQVDVRKALLGGNFTVEAMCRYVVEQKLVHYQQKANVDFSNNSMKLILRGATRYRLSQYEMAAMKTLLDESACKELKIDCDSFLDKIEKCGDYLGLIVRIDGAKIPVFADAVYVLYFAGRWLAGHLEKELEVRSKISHEDYAKLTMITSAITRENIF